MNENLLGKKPINILQRRILYMKQIYPFCYLIIGQIPPLDFLQTIDDILRKPILDYFCWHSAHNSIRWNIFGHKGIATNHSSIAYGHSLLNSNSMPYPYIIPNDRFLGFGQIKLCKTFLWSTMSDILKNR